MLYEVITNFADGTVEVQAFSDAEKCIGWQTLQGYTRQVACALLPGLGNGQDNLFLIQFFQGIVQTDNFGIV